MFPFLFSGNLINDVEADKLEEECEQKRSAEWRGKYICKPSRCVGKCKS